ncbi:MAG TPA: hypothetical protein VEW95_09315 [Candidatus Limnocylindrales bacterium]|nr:hypothetical protein [Candidatus Limnocylindrales bacterium]
MTTPAGPPPAAWVCSRCGATAGVEVDESFAQIDERYATGHCVVCTPWPRPKKLEVARRVDGQSVTTIQPPRKTVQLVRRDVWKPAIVKERNARQRRSKLARELGDGKVKPPNLDEARAARDHNLDGFLRVGDGER